MVRLRGEAEVLLLRWAAGSRARQEAGGWVTSGRGRERTESG